MIVSIIVPVYNAEKYLEKCISSILNQTYKQIEVILVNDGSTDKSSYICETMMRKDARIKVIHQQNEGPAHARNTGIQAASGEYIQFVDADDHIDLQMTAQLVNAMSPAVQLVICGYRSVGINALAEAFIPSIEGVFERQTFIKHLGELYHDTILPSPCNKLYRRQFINKHHIHFTEGVTIGEDLLFNLAYINVCTSMHIITEQLYNYAIVHTSITRSFNKNLYHHQKMLFEHVKAFLIKEYAYTAENKAFIEIMYKNSIINALNNLFHQHSNLDNVKRKKQIEKIVSDEAFIQMASNTEAPIQSRLVGSLIQKRAIHGLYFFFTLKRFLQYKLPPLFYLLKKINN